jgi:hypothetical protein
MNGQRWLIGFAPVSQGPKYRGQGIRLKSNSDYVNIVFSVTSQYYGLILCLCGIFYLDKLDKLGEMIVIGQGVSGGFGRKLAWCPSMKGRPRMRRSASN